MTYPEMLAALYIAYPGPRRGFVGVESKGMKNSVAHEADKNMQKNPHRQDLRNMHIWDSSGLKMASRNNQMTQGKNAAIAAFARNHGTGSAESPLLTAIPALTASATKKIQKPAKSDANAKSRFTDRFGFAYRTTPPISSEQSAVA